MIFSTLLFFQFYDFDFSLSIYYGRHFNFDYIACVQVCVLDSNTYNPNSAPSFTHAYLYKIHTYNIHTYICIIDSTPLGPQADFLIFNFFFWTVMGAVLQIFARCGWFENSNMQSLSHILSGVFFRFYYGCPSTTEGEIQCQQL